MELCRFHDDDYEACEKYSGQSPCEAEMKVQEYLREHGVEALRGDLGITVKEYDDLLVLNYSQINSPKTHPVVRECRGLILDKEFNVVSRSLDRFFNLGEAPETQKHLDWARAVCHEKVDGSLIKIYHHQGQWHISTRGTAYAESACNFGDAFYTLVLKALDCNYAEFQTLCNKYLSTEWTYVFELTCAENRIVKRYEGYTLYYLAARHNQSGEYGDGYEYDAAICLGATPVRIYHFSSAEDCVEMAKHLPDLEEGYVVYQDGEPVCKVKSPSYVAVHHIRGEGLTPKRIMELVVIGEDGEYLNYFNEDAKFFEPYQTAFERMLVQMQVVWQRTKECIEQKTFAMEVKDYPFSDSLFKARAKGMHPVDVFYAQQVTQQTKVLEGWMNA